MSAPGRADLLVEIGTEELPAHDQEPLALALCESLTHGLAARGLAPRVEEDPAGCCYSTPRRLAVLLTGVPEQEPDREVERRGPVLTAAFDGAGRATAAAEGFARAVGVPVAQLERSPAGRLVHRQHERGRPTSAVLGSLLPEIFAALPLPRRMRWGSGEQGFLRPVRWLLVRLGRETVPVCAFGLVASGESRGHRIHHPGPVRIRTPRDYSDALRAARVLADRAERRQTVTRRIAEVAQAVGAVPAGSEALYDEIAGMVEWPVALAARFDQRFLELPEAVIITTLAHHQRFVPLRDTTGQLGSHFVAVVNLDSRDSTIVRHGLERVVRPRLEDAAFYYRRDRERPLGDYLKDLEDIAFAPRLGSMADKSRRLCVLSGALAAVADADRTQAVRAATLAKCDLATGMVFEFPELQGVIGGHYAAESGEDPAVARAIAEQYLPGGPADALPESPAGIVLALTDRVDTLVGGFAAGLQPTGAKDPFGLRRAAFGVLRIAAERLPNFDLEPLLATAAEAFPATVDATAALPLLREFLRERLRTMMLEEGAAADVAQAVLSVVPLAPGEALQRVRALAQLRDRPELDALAGANKRIANILRQASHEAAVIEMSSRDGRTAEAAERNLDEALASARARLDRALAGHDYVDALTALAGLRDPVDRYFDEVLVMDPDPSVRARRLHLLGVLRDTFLRVADIGELQIRGTP